MKILITGGTGFVGKVLLQRLSEDGHDVTVLTRGIARQPEATGSIRYLQGDPTKQGAWQEAVKEHNVIINLAGASIFGRWSKERKKTILESRTLTTRNLVEAIPDKAGITLISISAVGYYGFHEDQELDESSPAGDDFLALLARDWEEEAGKAREKGARVVIARFGIVLGRDGGALQQMVPPFRFFVGGPIGSGLQWLSWIHMEDLVGAMIYLMDNPDLSGPFNLTAPNAVQNRDFSKTLGRVIGRPSWMPAPGFMVRLLLGEFGSVILKGQRVIPKRLLECGFSFRYSELEGALRDLLS
jgi:uncharacterized protein (TIGR01777 family)